MPPRKRRLRTSSSSTPASSPPPPSTSVHSSPKPHPKPKLPASQPSPTPPPIQQQHQPQPLLAAYKASLSHPNSFTVAAVTLDLYHHFIDWAITDIAVQFKHSLYLSAESKRHATLLQSATNPNSNNNNNNNSSNSSNPSLRTSHKPNNARLHYSDKNVTVECTNCSSNVSATRYAQHVQKCLGRGGRSSSRAALARLRASNERERAAERGGGASEFEEAPSRRRRQSEMSEGSHAGALSKRHKLSPVSSTASLHQRSAALPPTGRTRSSPP